MKCEKYVGHVFFEMTRSSGMTAKNKIVVIVMYDVREKRNSST